MSEGPLDGKVETLQSYGEELCNLVANQQSGVSPTIWETFELMLWNYVRSAEASRLADIQEQLSTRGESNQGKRL